MIELVPTFNFGGQCKEAIDLYQKAFHAQISCMIKYGEANSKDYEWDLTEEQKKYIFHSELVIGTQRIILNDNIDVPFATCYSSFVTVMFDTSEEVEYAYDILKEKSITIYSLKRTSYSTCRVVFIDQFGIRWGLMTKR